MQCNVRPRPSKSLFSSTAMHLPLVTSSLKNLNSIITTSSWQHMFLAASFTHQPKDSLRSKHEREGERMGGEGGLGGERKTEEGDWGRGKGRERLQPPCFFVQNLDVKC